MKNRLFKYSTVAMWVLAGVTILTTNVHADTNANAQSTVTTTSAAVVNNTTTAASSSAPTSAAQAVNDSTSAAASSANAVSVANSTASSSASMSTPVAVAPAAVDSWGDTGRWHRSYDNSWTYTKSDGNQASDEWAFIDGSWYYFEPDGKMADNGWYTTIWNDQAMTYYFDANGHYETNCWHEQRDSDRLDAKVTWTYSKSDGTQAENEWLYINGAWYYFEPDGQMLANGWYEEPWNGEYRYYHFDANGHCLN